MTAVASVMSVREPGIAKSVNDICQVELLSRASGIELHFVVGKFKTIGPREAVVRVTELLLQSRAALPHTLQSELQEAMPAKSPPDTVDLHALYTAYRLTTSTVPIAFPPGMASDMFFAVEPEPHCGWRISSVNHITVLNKLNW